MQSPVAICQSTGMLTTVTDGTASSTDAHPLWILSCPLQDFCIECPSTGTLFSLKDGSITSW